MRELIVYLKPFVTSCQYHTATQSYATKFKSSKTNGIQRQINTREPVLHLAALNGNTRLVVGLIQCGARINAQDGIGQTALTLAHHKEHFNTAKKLIDNGATLENELFSDMIPPLEIAKSKRKRILDFTDRRKN